MSKGAYTIIDSYVGKQEMYLTASAALHKRLKQTYEERLESGEYVKPEEAKPSFLDVTKTHMFFVKRIYKPFVAFAYDYFQSKAEVGNATKLPNAGEESNLRFNLRANNGDFINDMVVKIVFQAVGNPNGDPLTATRYRYCDFPGIKLFKRVEVTVDKDPIDEYTCEDVLFHMRHRIPDDKRNGFERMVGQEEVQSGTYYHADRNINQVMFFKDGPQTPKPYQEELELWVPLIFDFNTDIGRSLHNKVIGSQQVFIEFFLAPVREIIQALDSTNTVIPNGITSLEIKDFTLYTKNVYLNPEINDLFSEKYNLSMIRVHKRHIVSLTNNATDVLLSSLKYPIECMHFAFRPNKNVDFVNNAQNAFTCWHKMGAVTRKCVPIPAIINKASIHPYQQLVVRTARYEKCVPPVTQIGFKAHGNNVYPSLPENFYHDYQNYIIPGFMTPDECGYYSVTFSHYPTMFNPAGHINNSTAREFFIEYTSTFISNANPTTLYTSAQCINFLFYTQGSIQLKYIA